MSIFNRLFGNKEEERRKAEEERIKAEAYAKSDQGKLEALCQKLGVTQYSSEFDEHGSLTTLNLRQKGLTVLPPEIGDFSSLQTLDLQNNQLTYLPPEIGNLSNLKNLNLSVNRLTHLPPQIGNLTNLQNLWANHNQLTYLPPQIGNLSNLLSLNLSVNQLIQLPPQIGNLTRLEELALLDNRLTELPVEIGNLTKLQLLWLTDNKISQLPVEIGNLTKLHDIRLDDISLQSLPPEIVRRGETAIRAYLRDLPKLAQPVANPTPPPSPALAEMTAISPVQLTRQPRPRYEAKLLILGEGRMGKSSLLRALLGQPFVLEMDSTHGIEVAKLELEFDAGKQAQRSKLQLNVYDFGGQEIYHATHQFFFTERSLYLLAFNGGMSLAQTEVEKWLKNIEAIAPKSPVLLVATHLDQRPADVPWTRLKAAYPQLVGFYQVSNKTRVGFDALTTALVETARQLPLMAQPWPANWLAVEKTLLALPDHHLSLAKYIEYCLKANVEAEVATTVLGGLLHDLGKILYFQADPLLNQWVILKPHWITKAIALVMLDKSVQEAGGLLVHTELNRIWGNANYPSVLFPMFLRIMTQFELCYPIESEDHSPPTRSLIPQLLPPTSPVGQTLSRATGMPSRNQSRIRLIYQLGDFMPPNLMGRFIVRTHRYATRIYWRDGVVLNYASPAQGEGPGSRDGVKAWVEYFPPRREIVLQVQGTAPQNFFTLLNETLTTLLARVKFDRLVPCPCQADCRHRFNYDKLVKRLESGKLKVECEESSEELDLRQLLFGLHPSTYPQVVANIEANQLVLQRYQEQLLQGLHQGQAEILAEVRRLSSQNAQQFELITRQFSRQWNLAMQELHAECPNMFIILLERGTVFDPRNWFTKTYSLHLLCQNPTCPHLIPDESGYKLSQSKEWWAKISPWLKQMLKVLQYTVPAGQMVGLAQESLDQMQQGIDLLTQMDGYLPELQSDLDSVGDSTTDRNNKITGPALRSLHVLLDSLDPSHYWAGLHKTITPDGNILWLCEEHRQEYTR